MDRDEKTVLYRKRDILVSARLTADQLREFCEKDVLDNHGLQTVRGLAAIQDKKTMCEFIDLLPCHGKLGVVECLACVLQPQNTWLSDQLIAELETVRRIHTIDGATADELKGIIYKEYGNSRKLGQVEQKAILAMVSEQVTSVRQACSMQKQRITKAINEECTKHEASELAANDMATQIEAYLIRKDGDLMEAKEKYSQDLRAKSRASSGRPNGRSLGFDRLDDAIEAISAHTIDNLTTLEAYQRDKLEAMKVLKDTIDDDEVSVALFDAIMERPIGKLNEEINMQNNKLKAVDMRVASLEYDCEKIEREKPLEIAAKDELIQKIQCRLDSVTDRLDSLTEREAELNQELSAMQGEVDQTKLKHGFLGRSKTVRDLRKQEFKRRKSHQKLQTKDGRRRASANKDFVHFPKIVIGQGTVNKGDSDGSTRRRHLVHGNSSDGWETDDDN